MENGNYFDLCFYSLGQNDEQKSQRTSSQRREKND